MSLTVEQHAKLIELGNKSPKELRAIVYDYVPENITQLQKWDRGTLLAYALDKWQKEQLECPYCGLLECAPVVAGRSNHASHSS